MYTLELFQLYVGERLSKNHDSLGLCSLNAFNRHRLARTNAGISLLEALIVVFILAITSAAMVPSLISWRASMRLQSTLNELLGDLHSAKALAAKHNSTITVQFEPINNCYQINYTNSDNQIVALKQETLPPELRIDSSHPNYSLTNHRLSFTSRGGATPGTLVVSNLARKSKKIVVSSIGKIRMENLK